MVYQLLRCSLWLFTCALTSLQVIGQKNPQEAARVRARILSDKNVRDVMISEERQTPAMIYMDFKKANQPLSRAGELLANYLELRSGVDELKPTRTNSMLSNIEVREFQQYFKGIRVDRAGYKVLGRSNLVQFFNGNWYHIPSDFSISPVIDETTALTQAKNFINASKYAWENLQEMLPQVSDPQVQELIRKEMLEYFPKAELVIIKDFTRTGVADMRLAYKFNIYAAQPLSRQWVYVDARNGKILLVDKIIKHVKDPGKKTPPPASVTTTVHTRYAGVQTIKVKQISGNDPNSGLPLVSSHPTTDTVGGVPYIPGSLTYVLVDDTRGNGVETYDLNGVGGLPLSVGPFYLQGKSFTDVGGHWDSTEHTRGLLYGGANEMENDDIAWDAHWGAEVVYDYWLEKHGRSSYDGNGARIKSYIHYGPAYDNAFWNGTAMTYGDGSGVLFKALTSLDVCGHEIGHAVCTYTSDLVYEKESGAMNEGLSDIWAACIEHYAMVRSGSTVPANKYRPFYIGEQIGSTPDNPLRRMDNPKDQSNPDTYGGVNWQNPDCIPEQNTNDNCGVHTNSGVLNHWFFLLTAGSKFGTRPAGIDNISYYFPDSDDELKDASAALPNSIPYRVNGVGFDNAERVTFIMETLLSSTATFAEAREASIQAAIAISADPCGTLVESVTNAWFAVNVGPAWNPACTLEYGFVYTNTLDVTETGVGLPCEVQRTINLPVIVPATTTLNVATSGTATVNKDYTLSATSLQNNTGNYQVQTLSVVVKDDAVVDRVDGSPETIVLTLSGGALTNTVFTINVEDDDTEPRFGNDTIVFINEAFTGAPNNFTQPAGWTEVLELAEDYSTPTGNGQNQWGQFDNRIAIAFKPTATSTTGIAGTYNNFSISKTVIYRNGNVDTRGLNNLRVRFDYTVQGEVDPNSTQPDQFPKLDYLELVYSLDNGVTWKGIDLEGRYKFASAAVASGTFQADLPATLYNKQFLFGFRWNNDPLIGGPYSVSIDNLTLKSAPTKIENDLNHNSQESLVANERVYYYSTQDNQVVTRLEAAGSNCQTTSVVRTGTGNFTWYVDAGGFNRIADKIISVFPLSGAAQAFTVTLYFTEAQILSLELITGVPRSNFFIYHSTSTNYTTANGTNTTKMAASFSAIAGVGGSFSSTFNAEIGGTFAIGAPMAQAPLPAYCLDFSASKTTSGVSLQWKVTDERNNGGFIIERSADGLNYTAIGFVTADALNNGEYGFNDNSASGSAVYYRLKQTDLTGESRYLCTVLQVRLEGRTPFIVGNIYPNPSGGDEVFVNISSDSKKKITIEYITSAGQVVGRQIRDILPGTSRLTLNSAALSAGTYLVRFRAGDELVSEVRPLVRY